MPKDRNTDENCAPEPEGYFPYPLYMRFLAKMVPQMGVIFFEIRWTGRSKMA